MKIGDVVEVFEGNTFYGNATLWEKVATVGGHTNDKGVYEWTELWEAVYISGSRKRQKHTKENPLRVKVIGNLT